VEDIRAGRECGLVDPHTDLQQLGTCQAAQAAKTGLNMNRLTRHEFLEVTALTLGTCAMPWSHNAARASPSKGGSFLIGANYPGLAYGHDLGKNARGHDGLITTGWTYQTCLNGQGFTDTRC
jgi:hypothetical protein